MTGLTIRPARPADEAALLALADRLPAFGPTTRSAEEVSLREGRVLLEALAAPKNAETVLVAERPPGAVIGVLLLEERKDYFTGAPHGHLAILSVAKDAEGRGVGAALLRAAEAWAAGRGYRRMTLNVFTDNTRALGFYSKNGWRPELMTYFKDFA